MKRKYYCNNKVNVLRRCLIGFIGSVFYCSVFLLGFFREGGGVVFDCLFGFFLRETDY